MPTVFFLGRNGVTLARMQCVADVNDARSNILRRSVISVSLSEGEIILRRYSSEPLYEGWDLNYSDKFFDDHELRKVVDILPDEILAHELLRRA